VQDAWARAADSGMVTAVYLILRNPENGAVTLTGANSPLAASVSLHMTHEMDGMMHMMPLDSAVVAPGDSLVLVEGARHLMVNGLRRTLLAGDSLPVQLHFAGGRALDLRAVVRSP
jgi:copper(I)-binding protein